MLEGIFGNQNAERVLFYLLNNGAGYPRQVAMALRSSLTPIQKQLERLEMGGILASRLVGRTRVYQMNPRYYFRPELEALLRKAFAAMPEPRIKETYSRRSRPRRKGKP